MKASIANRIAALEAKRRPPAPGPVVCLVDVTAETFEVAELRCPDAAVFLPAPMTAAEWEQYATRQQIEAAHRAARMVAERVPDDEPDDPMTEYTQTMRRLRR